MIEFTALVKSAAVVVALWLAPTAPGVAQSAGESGKELLRIQDKWAAARVKRDVAYPGRLYAKEFRVQSVNGSVVSREADIGVFASGELKRPRRSENWPSVGDVAPIYGRRKNSRAFAVVISAVVATSSPRSRASSSTICAKYFGSLRWCEGFGLTVRGSR